MRFFHNFPDLGPIRDAHHQLNPKELNKNCFDENEELEEESARIKGPEFIVKTNVAPKVIDLTDTKVKL